MPAAPKTASTARRPSGRPAHAPSSGPAAPADWQKLRPKTLVDQVIDAVVSAAAQGLILPGDRIVESEIAQKLGVSRVPVREALRILESQGVVVSEPYKGIRLTPVTPQRIDNLLDVRVALETSAAVRAIRLGLNRGEALRAFETAITALERTRRRRDVYGFAAADTEFHRALCRLSGNRVLCDLWEMLSRQMTIVFGLSALGTSMQEIVDGHRILLDVFKSGDEEAMGQALDDHISVQTHAVDFQTIIAERRSRRSPEPASRPTRPRRISP